MGNAASVSPNESDVVVTKKKKPKPNGRKVVSTAEANPPQVKEATPPAQVAAVKRDQEASRGPRQRASGDSKKPAKAPDATPAHQGVDFTLEKVTDSRKDAPAAVVRPAIHNRNDPEDRRVEEKLQQAKGRKYEVAVDEGSTEAPHGHQEEFQAQKSSGDSQRRGSGEGAASGGNTSESSGESYTSSSYYSESEESGDASDDTFFVPEDKRDEQFDDKEDSLDGGGSAVRIIVDGDRGDSADIPAEEISASGEKQRIGAEEKEKPGTRAGKPKRKRPANRHYIKDETMRTLFGLLPFYGGDGGPMDQMVKATLASVGPNTIDVRDQEGNTLLIVACQHACEDLVEPILAKGASPTATNGVGICPLHYTCFADSLSYDVAEALLWRGADPSAAETTYGCTPLHYAASAGDADLCALLMEHGAQPQTQDFYTYTAVKYAKDAGHETIVELLGGEEDTDLWLEAEEVYVGAEQENDGESSLPSKGLWIRHMDPETELAYYMNDETGESWWETDLLAVAEEFLAAAPAAGGAAGSRNGAALATPFPPIGVREWLLQGQVRSWLVTIFSRVDPLRLMEVDLVLQIGKADFKEMVKNILVRYGVKELDFLRSATSPKLEPLGVSLLMPSTDELGQIGDGKTRSPSPERSRDQNAPAEPGSQSRSGGDEETPKNAETAEPAAATAPVGVGDSNSVSSGGTGGAGGHEPKPTLTRITPSQHSLKRVDSPAVLRAEADKLFQEAVLKQEVELAEERKRQNNVLDEQRRIVQNLEDMMKKRQAALALAKKHSDDISDRVAKQQLALEDERAGLDASDQLSEEIAHLKAGVATERVRFSHITEALEATKGSLEERLAKHQALEEDRRVRLELLRSENDEEVKKLRTDAADTLNKAEQGWEEERTEMERGLTQQVEQVSALLKETVEGAAKVLSEAAVATKSATDEVKQRAGQVEEAKGWMKANEEAHSKSKQIDHTNKQLHTSLRREMERAKQLHNQIEDTKGQTRIYARVRPMSTREREGSCKEVCLRDGKQTLALLTAAQQHWTYTHVFQNPSTDASATSAGQTELHREVAGLGTTLADGNSVLLIAAGAAGSGKTLTLVGDPDEARDAGGFFFDEVGREDGTEAGAPPTLTGNRGEKKVARKGKGKGGGADGAASDALGEGGGGVAAKAKPLAGIFPRLVAEAFATLNHRSAQCAFVVWVSAAAVSVPAEGGNGGVVECLLPPPSPVGGDSPGEEAKGGDGRGTEHNKQRDPHLPPLEPPEDRLWGRAVPASSPQEAMAIVEDSRSRVVAPSSSTSGAGGPHASGTRHFLSRIRVELVNRSTNETSSCEMVAMELGEEKPGETWSAALAEVLRAHAAAAIVAKPEEADGFLGMVRGCLTETSKVVTLLCVSPADTHAEKTERVLSFGKACENSSEDGASQLRDLKKELARLKKEAKGTKKPAPSQLPRPAGGKRS